MMSEIKIEIKSLQIMWDYQIKLHTWVIKSTNFSNDDDDDDNNNNKLLIIKFSDLS